jgi:hypothetical protein
VGFAYGIGSLAAVLVAARVRRVVGYAAAA